MSAQPALLRQKAEALPANRSNMATSESELGLMDGIWALERGGKKVQSSLFFHEEHADPLHPGKRAPWIAWALGRPLYARNATLRI